MLYAFRFIGSMKTLVFAFIQILYFHFFYFSASKGVEILEAYEGTLEEDYPPDNERCEHSEMLLYKVFYILLLLYVLC